jgi:transcription initiation factor TFIID subunit 15
LKCCRFATRTNIVISDPANFINTCAGKTLTNGLQNPNGSCNGIPMGDIPAQENMVSTLILSPQDGQQIGANQTFNVTLQLVGLNPGFFTNADTTYYSAPQKVGQNGLINGHTHVVIQTLESQTQPPDPTKFAFFEGINDKGNGQGELTTAVTGGLPEGKHRICTMAASENHQSPAMPVAKRGPPDDCIRITVTAAAGGNGNTKGQATTTTTNNGSGNKDKGVGKAKDKGGDKAKDNKSSAPPDPSVTPCP